MEDSEKKMSHADRVYHETMALFAALKDNPNGIQVRRAEIRQGEVKAEPIDFIADVQIKASRYINSLGDTKAEVRDHWDYVLRNPDNYDLLWVGIREALGQAFDTGKLGIDGDYKLLYFRVKNNRERAPKEASSGNSGVA